MTLQEIEASYKQAIISHIAEKDIAEIKILITSNINFQKDIEKKKISILEIVKTLSKKHEQKANITFSGRQSSANYRESALKVINIMTNKIKEFENCIEQNILNIKKIISTRNERIMLYLEGD